MISMTCLSNFCNFVSFRRTITVSCVCWSQASESEKLLCAGDACTGDVVLFEQNVYDL